MTRVFASLRIAAIGAFAATAVLAAPPATSPAPASNNQRAAAGFDPGQRALLEKVNTYFNSVTTLVGKFVQVGPDGNKTEGQFYMQKPGKIRFEYNPPSPIELISDGDTVAVRDTKLVTQDIYPLSQTPLKFLLSDKLDLMKDANVVGTYQDELFVTVVIEERNVLAGTHRLMIMFGKKDMQLKQWTVTDPQGYDTTVAVSDLDTGKKLDPKLFKINFERMLQ
jgi:outer membrane lipoprotein-sorting protein